MTGPERRCPRCRQMRPLTDYVWRNGRWVAVCIDCRRRSARARYRHRYRTDPVFRQRELERNRAARRGWRQQRRGLPQQSPYRRCPRCGQQRLPETFVGAYCQPCRRAYEREWQRLRYRTDPALRERKLANKREWRRRQQQEREREADARLRLAQRLIAALRERGWGGWRIARAIGVSLSTVYGWKGGVQRPTESRLAALRRLAKEVGIHG